METTLELWASSLREVKRRDAAAVHAGARGALCGAFSGWPAWRGAAQDRLDTIGSRGRSRTVASTSHPRSRPVGRRTRCAISCAIMRSRSSPTTLLVLVIDETGFLKQGKASCGVARQYTGSAGKITTARSASSPAMSRSAATPSSTASFICPRAGRTTRRAWPRRMCRKR